jgi:hypothetical protein
MKSGRKIVKPAVMGLNAFRISDGIRIDAHSAYGFGA